MNDNNKRPDIFREAVSIETQRIFDTCSDRDCICDLPVVLDQCCSVTDKINIIKTRCAEVCRVCTSVDPVPFKSGYYSVDITYTFRILMDAYEDVCTEESIPLSGTAVWSKRVILYGAQGDIKTFTSDEIPGGASDTSCRVVNKPRVTVSVVTPIALETKIECRSISCPPACEPVNVRGIFITLGLFAVIQLTRPVSLLIPAYDYCIPGRECSRPTESAEDIFCRLDFPTEQFFPKAVREKICGCEEDLRKNHCGECGCRKADESAACESCADDDIPEKNDM